MAEYIDERIVRARKVHICDFCHEDINPGTKYRDFVGKEAGQVYHHKSHLRCAFIASELEEYVSPWDGMTDDEFMEGCNNFCREFLCDKCPNWDKKYRECKEDFCGSSECIDKVGETLLKYDFVAEKRFPNKPVSRFWNPYRRYLRPKTNPLDKYPGED